MKSLTLLNKFDEGCDFADAAKFIREYVLENHSKKCLNDPYVLRRWADLLEAMDLYLEYICDNNIGRLNDAIKELEDSLRKYKE